jgi:hypothetical protein
MSSTRIWGAVVVFGLALTACGSDDDGGTAGTDNEELEELEDFADAVNEAQGAGGGGTLTFDGTEHPIDSALCTNDGGRIDVGTVGPDFYRIFVTGEVDDLRLQILTPEGVQWFDGSPTQENKPTVTVEGSIITATGGTFFNNQDDQLIVAEFTIECPDSLL